MARIQIVLNTEFNLIETFISIIIVVVDNLIFLVYISSIFPRCVGYSHRVLDTFKLGLLSHAPFDSIDVDIAISQVFCFSRLKFCFVDI